MEYIITFSRIVVNSLLPASLLFIMADFKCKRRTAWVVYCAILVVAMGCSLLVLTIFGEVAHKRVFFICFLVPTVVAMLVLTVDRPAFIFFNCSTALNILYFVSIVGGIITGANDDLILVDMLIRIILYVMVIAIFRRYLREPYHFLARNMDSQWRIIAVVPFLFFALVMFMGLYPTVRTDNLYSVFFLYLILGFVYYIIYCIFRKTYDLLLHKQDHQLLEVHVTSLRNQMDTIQTSELQTRILRHDMRHVLGNIATQLAAGDIDGAQQCLQSASEQVANVQNPSSYCENSVVNATLAYYCDRAKREGIAVTTRLAIPSELPVDALELSTVFANALENAIHACMQIPPDQRQIDCRCRLSPNFLLEISNTYNGQLQRDKDDLPINHRQGHGIGTRSIIAFVEKYNSIIDYHADGDRFWLRIAQVATAK